MPQPFINPNYLNTYPNAYPYQPQMQPPMDRLQQLQAPYQMPQQTQVPQVPQTNQGILWVQGEAGAKSYLVAPSTSILLMDSENEYFYIKITDAAGMPTLRTFEYKEIVNGQKKESAPAENLDEKYVTRNEYQDLKAKYDELYGLLESSTAPSGKGK